MQRGPAGRRAPLQFWRCGGTDGSERVLADFSRMDVKHKRLVVHDGTGHSFWLAPNREKELYSMAFITKSRRLSLVSATAFIGTMAVAAVPAIRPP